MSTVLEQESLAHWEQHQVARFGEGITERESLEALNARNALYPGLLELMPLAGFAGQTVLDFGCGPGHDTIGFLLNGAERVYALDVSSQGLASLRHRLAAHRFEERCVILDEREQPRLPTVDHVHAAGVIHHLADPIAALRRLASALRPSAEIRMMVYDRDSELVRRLGGPEQFEGSVDGAAPIAKCWTRREVGALASHAGLRAFFVGSYRVPGEIVGPGLSACYSLRK